MHRVSSQDLDRPLSPAERGIWLTDAGAPLNYSLVARISGGIDAETLRAALDAAQARHPMLRARVVESEGVWRFCSKGVGPIPMTVERGPESGWLPRVEDDLTQRHPTDGPLLRVILRQHEDDDAATLLMSSHHVIGDGRSGTCLLRDVLQAAGRIAAGEAPGLDPLPCAQPMDDVMPAARRGLRGLLHNALFMARTMFLATRNGTPVPVRMEQETPAHSRRARIHPVVLEARTLDTLQARCRSEGTTVHGALAAAMILGILKDHDAEASSDEGDGAPGTSARTRADADLPSRTVGFGIPVDMRGRLDPPVGDGLGFYVSMISFEKRLRSDSPFWDLARDIRTCIVDGRRRGDDFSASTLSPKLGRWLGAGRLPPREFVEKWEKHIRGTGGLSNLGRLDIPTQYGALRLDSCHFAFTPSALGQFSACVAALDGRLFWDFTWPDPSMTRPHAEALIGGIVRTLKQAIAC